MRNWLQSATHFQQIAYKCKANAAKQRWLSARYKGNILKIFSLNEYFYIENCIPLYPKRANTNQIRTQFAMTTNLHIRFVSTSAAHPLAGRRFRACPDANRGQESLSRLLCCRSIFHAFMCRFMHLHFQSQVCCPRA